MFESKSLMFMRQDGVEFGKGQMGEVLEVLGVLQVLGCSVLEVLQAPQGAGRAIRVGATQHAWHSQHL